MVRVDISSQISTQFKPYFGRYKWINLTLNEESSWYGCSLNNTIANNIDFNEITLTKIYIVGNVDLFENEVASYSLIGIRSDNLEIDLTDRAEFSILNTNISTLNNNSLTTKEVTNNEIQILNAKVTFNNKEYETSLNIFIKPIKLVRIEIECQNKINDNSSIQYKIYGYYSNNTKVDLSSSATLTTNISSLIIDSNRKEINSNLFSNDEIGTLYASYNDTKTNSKFETSKFIKCEKVKVVALSTTLPSTFDFNNSKKIEYTFSATFSNGTVKDITNDIQLTEIGSNFVSFITEDNKKYIKLNDNIDEDEFDFTILANYVNEYYDTDSISKYFKITATRSALTNFSIEIEKTILNENEETIYKAYIYRNSVKYDITNDVEVTCTTNANISFEDNKIVLGKFVNESSLLIKFTYSSNSLVFEKYETIYVSPIGVSDTLLINGDLTVESNSTHTYKFFMEKTNGELAEITPSATISFVGGNNDLVSINETTVTFNDAFSSDENVLLKAEYFSETFNKTLSALLSIKINKSNSYKIDVNKFYKCANVGTNSWSGYALIKSTDFGFSTTLTSNLPISGLIPTVGRVYSENTLFELTNIYYNSIPTSGRVLYVPLQTSMLSDDVTISAIGGCSYEAYESKINWAYFNDRTALVFDDEILPLSGADFSIGFFTKLIDNTDNTIFSYGTNETKLDIVVNKSYIQISNGTTFVKFDVTNQTTKYYIVTYSNGKVTLYVNNVLIGTKDLVLNISSSEGCIGASANTHQTLLNGYLTNLLVYNRILLENEREAIQKLCGIRED